MREGDVLAVLIEDRPTQDDVPLAPAQGGPLIARRVGPLTNTADDSGAHQAPQTEPRGVVGFEVILSAYTSLLSMAATESVSLVS
ncbi:hypothetical protein [Nocardioides sp. cx-173]|uniref:hypothetical protein n=1 Tax=Nocardioides sp. cx-173 TaxID=2898796 RepID=UPI001E2D03D7|nr:hypothetical protein [Nocardioides sp. cx-173]MCD4525945.1 hypothetical protein [Nocardioides sp. cx-173]